MSLYDHLGVPPNATPDEIKKAYRTRAQKHHPDKEGGDADAFQKVQSAYDVLGDAERRARYDATGETGSERTREQVLREIAANAIAKTMEAFSKLSLDILKRTNIPKTAKRVLLTKQREVLKGIAEVERHIRQFNDCLERTDKDSITAGVITGAIERARRHALDLSQQAADLADAADLLDKEKYRHDARVWPDDALRDTNNLLYSWGP